MKILLTKLNVLFLVLLIINLTRCDTWNRYEDEENIDNDLILQRLVTQLETLYGRDDGSDIYRKPSELVSSSKRLSANGFAGVRGKKWNSEDMGEKRGPPDAFGGVRGKKGAPPDAFGGVRGKKGGPPDAFAGVRGKKGGPPDAFAGVRGKKGGPPDAFAGVRGKKSEYTEGVSESAEKRGPPDAFTGVRGKKSEMEELNEINEIDDNMKRAPPVGFSGVRGRRIPSDAFFGARGKKAPVDGFMPMRG